MQVINRKVLNSACGATSTYLGVEGAKRHLFTVLDVARVRILPKNGNSSFFVSIYEKIEGTRLIKNREECDGRSDLSDDGLDLLGDLLQGLVGLDLPARRNQHIKERSIDEQLYAPYSPFWMVELHSTSKTHRSRVSFDSIPFTTRTSF